MVVPLVFKLLPETVWVVPFKNTALVLCVNVPLLAKLPVTYISPPETEDNVNAPVAAMLKEPPTNKPWLVVPIFTAPVPVVVKFPPTVTLALMAFRLNAPPEFTNKLPFMALAVVEALATSNVPVLTVTLLG